MVRVLRVASSLTSVSACSAMERTRKHVPPAYAAKLEPGPNRPGIHETAYLMAYDYMMLTNDKVRVRVVVRDYDEESAVIAVEDSRKQRILRSIDKITKHHEQNVKLVEQITTQ